MGRSEAGSRACRILVVEDEFFLADDLTQALITEGIEVVGPFSEPDTALATVLSGTPVDAAVLDINLRDQSVFPLADLLAERAVPFVFATGYDVNAVPSAYQAVPRWEKPYRAHDLAKVVSAMAMAQSPGS